MTKAMHHEPGSFLSDIDILSKLGRDNATLMVSDHPYGHHPLPHRNFRILKNGPDFNAKAPPAFAALMSTPVREMIHLGRITIRAKCAVFPPDRREVVNRRLFIGYRAGQLHETTQSLHLDHHFEFINQIYLIVN